MPVSLPTGRRGQFLALGVTVIACGAIWIGAVAPLLQAYEDRNDTLHRQQAIGRRMEALAQTLPALQQHVSQATTLTVAADALLPGSSDALAAAVLQQKLDAVAKASGLRIGSEEIIPAQASGAFRKIAVRATINAPWESVVELLRALAEAETPMVVNELTLRGPASATRDPALPVDASFTVSSLRAATPPSGQTAAESAPDARVQPGVPQP